MSTKKQLIEAAKRTGFKLVKINIDGKEYHVLKSKEQLLEMINENKNFTIIEG